MTNLRIAEYKGVESTDNSTTASLGIGGVFTGEWEEIKDYASIKINAYTDQDSATLGLDLQQSPDQNIIHHEYFELYANDGEFFTPNPVCKYFRIVYTNGSVAQTTFYLQTIYSSVYAKPSSHRLSDTVSGNDDVELTKSAISFLNEVDDEYKNVGIQNPFPIDGDSAYAKDIWVAQSDMGDFSGSVTDLFDNLHTIVTDTTANNPKELFIHFNRTVVSNVVGLGSFSGSFSNTEIEIYNSGMVGTTVIDESADATVYTNRTFQLPTTAGFNAIKFIFHTVNTITLSNIVLIKTRGVVARLQATKPDNTVTDINATNGGNLKISLEELESGISSNSNSQLNVTQFDSSGNEIESQLNTAFTDNLDGKYGQISASALYGRVDDTLLVPLKVDGSTQDMQVVIHEHAKIHGGDHYIISDVVDLAINNVFDIQFTTPNTTKWGHFVFKISAESETEWYIYENVTINLAGTTITPINNNRNSANTSAMTVAGISNTSVANANTDTAVAGALQVEHGIIGAGRDAGADDRDAELVLKQNEDYTIRFIATAAGYVDYVLSWYEHTDKN